MKILVVFYSRTGNTQKVADFIVSKLNCEVEQIHDLKDRSGIIGWIIGGRDGTYKKFTALGKIEKVPSNYDLVVIGTPIWVNTPPAIRTYLQQYSGQFKKTAFFCTMGGSGFQNLFKEMAFLTGTNPIATLAITTSEVQANNFQTRAEKFITAICSK